MDFKLKLDVISELIKRKTIDETKAQELLNTLPFFVEKSKLYYLKNDDCVQMILKYT